MLRTVFVLAILSFGLTAGLFSRYAALLLYLWFAMFRPVEWLWIDISQYRPSLVVGAMLVLPCLATGIFPVIVHPLAIGSAVFLAFSTLAQAGAIRPDIGWTWLDYVARLILVSLLIAPVAKTPRRVLIAIGVIAGSFLFHGAKAGLASILGGGAAYSAGLSGAFIDNNGYAVGISMAMFLFLGVAQAVPWRIPRWAMIVVAGPLSAMAVVSLFSRGGLLALAAGTITYVLLQRRIWGGLLAIVLVVATVVYLPRPQGYEARISPITGQTEVTQDESAVSRMHFWKTALVMARARPFGVGLWNYAQAYDQYDSTNGLYGRSRSVHNSVLQVLAETGFGGFAAYLFLLLWSIRILFRVRARGKDPTLTADERRIYASVGTGGIASMVAFLVGGSTVSLALNDMTWLTFGAVIALDRLVPVRQPAAAPALAAGRDPWPASST